VCVWGGAVARFVRERFRETRHRGVSLAAIIPANGNADSRAISSANVLPAFVVYRDEGVEIFKYRRFLDIFWVFE